MVRTRLYITPGADAAAVGAVHGELLGHVRPAATMVVVAGLLDPAWKVEVEAEAVLPVGGSHRPATVAATMLVPRRSPTSPASMRFMT